MIAIDYFTKWVEAEPSKVCLPYQIRFPQTRVESSSSSGFRPLFLGNPGIFVLLIFFPKKDCFQSAKSRNPLYAKLLLSVFRVSAQSKACWEIGISQGRKLGFRGDWYKVQLVAMHLKGRDWRYYDWSAVTVPEIDQNRRLRRIGTTENNRNNERVRREHG